MSAMHAWLTAIAGACLFAATAAAQSLTLQTAELSESSGIADVGGELWSHNDSGDGPRLFSFDRSGQSLSVIRVTHAEAIDWEDMCAFTCDGRQYVAIGDVGDNLAERQHVDIYVMEIPDSKSLTLDNPLRELRATAHFKVTYPTGPVNCESVCYDPIRRVFLLASKETLRCRLFEIDATRLAGIQWLQARLVDTVLLPMVTAGDISPDGKLLVLATYGPGCLIERAANGRWRTTGDQALKIFELPKRRQGESICFSNNGLRLLLTSEFYPTPLYDIPLPNTAP